MRRTTASAWAFACASIWLTACGANGSSHDAASATERAPEPAEPAPSSTSAAPAGNAEPAPCAPAPIFERDIKDFKRVGELTIDVAAAGDVKTSLVAVDGKTSTKASNGRPADLDEYIQTEIKTATCALGGSGFSRRGKGRRPDPPFTLVMDLYAYGPPNDRVDAENVCHAATRSGGTDIPDAMPSQLRVVAAQFLSPRLTTARWANWRASWVGKSSPELAQELEAMAPKSGASDCPFVKVLRQPEPAQD